MAQLGGEPRKVKLIKDLTKYNIKLTIGQEGVTIPNKEFSSWGSFDDFVAVAFDNGVELDVSYTSLKFK
jgi:hypothetical protein